MVDAKLIAPTPAYAIATLPKEHQSILLDAMECEQVTPSVSQAHRIKKLSMRGELTSDAVLEIMMEQKKPIRSDVTLAGEKIRKYQAAGGMAAKKRARSKPLIRTLLSGFSIITGRRKACVYQKVQIFF